MMLRKLMEFRAKYSDVEKEWAALEEDLMQMLNIDEGDITQWAQEFFYANDKFYGFRDKLEWYFEQLKTFDLQRIVDKLESEIGPKAIKGEMLKDKHDGHYYVSIETISSVKAIKGIVDKYYFSRFSGSFDEIVKLGDGLRRMSLIIAPVGSY